MDLASILQNSLFRTMTHKATCQNCRQYNTFTTCRSLSSRSLPPFLAVNASVYNEDGLSFWQDSRSQRSLPPQVHLHGQVRGIDDSEKIPYVICVCHSFLFPYMDRLHSKFLGYGGASYDATGRIALGGNDKRWAFPTTWS
jgi:Ubiquitin carboxyl-terminal hydrolase